MIEGDRDGLVEPIELSQPCLRHESVSAIRMEESGDERRVDFVEQFEEDQTDLVTLWQELIAARMWELLNQALGAEF